MPLLVSTPEPAVKVPSEGGGLGSWSWEASMVIVPPVEVTLAPPLTLVAMCGSMSVVAPKLLTLRPIPMVVLSVAESASVMPSDWTEMSPEVITTEPLLPRLAVT